MNISLKCKKKSSISNNYTSTIFNFNRIHAP